jgi:hypothetical protein
MMKEGRMFEIDGFKVEIGNLVSTDDGLAFVVRRIWRSQRFRTMVVEMRKAVVAVNTRQFGFAAEAKLT